MIWEYCGGDLPELGEVPLSDMLNMQGEVNLTMEKCVLAKSSNCGLHVLKNFSAPVLVSACQFSEACYFGVKAAACTTEVQLVDCVMKDNRQYGAGAWHRASERDVSSYSCVAVMIEDVQHGWVN